MKRRLLTLILAAAPLTVLAAAEEAPQNISISELIASPAKYQNHAVTVNGYYVLRFEHSAICPQKSDPYKKCLWVSSAYDNTTKGQRKSRVIAGMLQQFSNQTVSITGTFNAQNSGHLGLWPGSLEKITAIW